MGADLNPLTPTVAIWVRAGVPGCQKITYDVLTPIWHRMLYSCTHMATVGVKGLSNLKFSAEPC